MPDQRVSARLTWAPWLPLVDILGGQVDELAGAEGGDDVVAGQTSAGGNGVRIPSRQTVVEPVVHRGLSNGEPSTDCDGDAVFVVADDLLEPGAGLAPQP